VLGEFKQQLQEQKSGDGGQEGLRYMLFRLDFNEYYHERQIKLEDARKRHLLQQRHQEASAGGAGGHSRGYRGQKSEEDDDDEDDEDYDMSEGDDGNQEYNDEDEDEDEDEDDEDDDEDEDEDEDEDDEAGVSMLSYNQNQQQHIPLRDNLVMNRSIEQHDMSSTSAPLRGGGPPNNQPSGTMMRNYPATGLQQPSPLSQQINPS
jgi:hypothetical protein